MRTHRFFKSGCLHPALKFFNPFSCKDPYYLIFESPDQVSLAICLVKSIATLLKYVMSSQSTPIYIFTYSLGVPFQTDIAVP